MTSPEEEVVRDDGADKGSGFSPCPIQPEHSFSEIILTQSPSFAWLPESPDIGKCAIMGVGNRTMRESRGWRGLGLELGDRPQQEMEQR